MHQAIDTEPATTNHAASNGDHGNGQSQDAPVHVMAVLEDILSRGRKLVEENPTAAVVGVASLAAIVVLAAKSAAPRETSVTRLERQVRRLASEQRAAGSEALETISGAVTRALTADPKYVQAYQNFATDWIGRIQAGVSDALSKVQQRT